MSVSIINELVSRKRYKLARVPIKYSNQPAHPHSLIRVLDGHSLGRQCPDLSSCINSRLWSDCKGAQTNLNHRCSHIQACDLYWISIQSLFL